MHKMKIEDIPLVITSETKRLVIAMADDRAEKLRERHDAIEEINRIRNLIKEEEDKIAIAKEEVRRILKIKKSINNDLSKLTNKKIAERMEIPVRKVCNILACKTSSEDTQAKIRAEIERRNSPEYKSNLKSVL